jgi:tyrosine-protein phosphatase YwqE
MNNLSSPELFIRLLHMLQKYSDAMVLQILLEQHADKTEFKTSARQIAMDFASGQIVRRQAQQALSRLAEKGLIDVQVHPNYRTHIKVDREAVLALLRIPVSDFLPGLRQVNFPFLEALNAERQSQDSQDARV